MSRAVDIVRLAAIIDQIKRTKGAVKQDSSAGRIASIAEEIRNALLRRFREVERAGFQLLYDALSGGGIPTATLSVCGKGTREIRYTQLLRYFLDPTEPHGLGDRVLRAALMTFDVSLSNLNLMKAIVQAEVDLGLVEAKRGSLRSYLDLMIEVEGHYILIEHKINSAEGEGLDEETGQVARYDEAVAKNLQHITESNSTRVYLTPSGMEAKGDLNWLPVSHLDLVRNLTLILDDSSISAVARHNLCSVLWDLLMGPVGIDKLTMLEMRGRIHQALNVDERQSIQMKQWCEMKNIPWKRMLYILEKSYDKKCI